LTSDQASKDLTPEPSPGRRAPVARRAVGELFSEIAQRELPLVGVDSETGEPEGEAGRSGARTARAFRIHLASNSSSRPSAMTMNC
jgi:hypothetical protein